MPIDPYSQCPGGTGKKIKFCCADLVGELEKIYRMLDNKQPQACLDHIERLEARYPDRACLLTTKAMLQQSLGQAEQARRTTEQVLAVQPDNPVALAEAAILEDPKHDVRTAVELLQRAIAASPAGMDHRVFEAIGVVAVKLLDEGHVPAALAHLMLQSRIEPNYPLATNLLVSVMQSPAVPLALKDMPQALSLAPAAAVWKSKFEAAWDLASRAQWAPAAKVFAKLALEAPAAGEVWRNLALLRTYLADDVAAAEAWRRYAALDVPADDAADALMLAYFLDHESQRTVELLSATFPIADQEQVALRLASDRRLVRLPIEGIEWNQGDQPPPRSAHLLLDKPLASTGVDLDLDHASAVSGRLFVYGRQTDREARLELIVHRDQLDAATAALTDVAGDALAARESEQVLGETSVLLHVLSASLHLPDDTPAQRATELAAAWRRRLLTEKWVSAPNDVLDGGTPAQAAAEATPRVKLRAAVRVLEQALAEPLSAAESAAVRERLGLAPEEPIARLPCSAASFPLTRLSRLQVEDLSDDDLRTLYQRAVFVRVKPALEKIVNAVLSRPGLEGKVDKAQALGVLASIESDAGRALEWIGKACAAAEAAGRSSAPWDLDELSLLLNVGEVEGAVRLINHIQSQHAREPGVAERLLQLLYDAGIVDEHGRPIERQQPKPAGLVVPGSTAEPGKLWTPGSETAGGKKAALWTPGMG